MENRLSGGQGNPGTRWETHPKATATSEPCCQPGDRPGDFTLVSLAFLGNASTFTGHTSLSQGGPTPLWKVPFSYVLNTYPGSAHGDPHSCPGLSCPLCREDRCPRPPHSSCRATPSLHCLSARATRTPGPPSWRAPGDGPARELRAGPRSPTPQSWFPPLSAPCLHTPGEPGCHGSLSHKDQTRRH